MPTEASKAQIAPTNLSLQIRVYDVDTGALLAKTPDSRFIYDGRPMKETLPFGVVPLHNPNAATELWLKSPPTGSSWYGYAYDLNTLNTVANNLNRFPVSKYDVENEKYYLGNTDKFNLTGLPGGKAYIIRYFAFESDYTMMSWGYDYVRVP